MRLFPQPASLTASVIGSSCRLADRRIAARASRKGLGERDDEASSDCCDRVGDVPFGSDRQRLWVGNPREWQIPRAARRNVVLRGGWRLVRRSKSRRRQYRGWHGGGSRAIRAPHNHQARVPASAPDNRARSAIASLRNQPNIRRRYPPAKWQTNTWSAPFLLAATRSAATLRRAARSARYRDVPAAPSAAQSAKRARLRWQRPSARGPDRGIGTDPGHIAQAERGNLRSQPRVVAVTGIHQHHTLRQSGGSGRFDLLKSDLGLGLESDRFRDLRLVPARLVLRPILSEIEPISDGKAGLMVGQRQRHRDLTVILLAELAAILPGHPDRVPPLLGKARVVDDPGLDWPAALDRRQHQFCHLAQHRGVRPRRIT